VAWTNSKQWFHLATPCSALLVARRRDRSFLGEQAMGMTMSAAHLREETFPQLAGNMMLSYD